ncbi:hypothetical protein SCP_0402120 [Sparassis crispa]|uniref:Transcription factor tau subunit sfc6 n=1 Tax=Sparassis crispa TaxID=139825 RepID=A0A401GI56_9APHY|nr:hypothetical protein SCP_0402120 [Sparassis crispa]GBE81838.1 hypothetical protein SCP_0402120 [Sparassis crispa]
MTRQLRSRASRLNYATLFQYEDGDGAGPSNPFVDEADSGSDFAPEANEAQEGEGDAMAEDVEEQEQELKLVSDSDHERSVIGPAGTSGGHSAPAAKPRKTVSLPPGLSRTATRQQYALPALPGVHHRHRAVALYRRDSPVERLAKAPMPFAPDTTVLTKSSTADSVVAERVGKSWGFNVGPGPLWELMEDRGWFKEEIKGDGEEKELNRRPRVYESIKVDDYEVLNLQEAAPYLPNDVVADKDVLNAPSSITCSFGPFGQQTRVEMKMFEAQKIADFIPGSKSHVFNAGTPVWALDWCPIHPDDRFRKSHKQYLAIAPFPSRAHSPSIGVRATRPSHACIQIWSLAPSRDAMEVDDEDSTSKNTEDDPGEMKCEMLLCLDSGPAYELKWCPLPSNDACENSQLHSGQSGPRKLGIIGGTFEDGSFSLYVVPDPATLVSYNEGDHGTGPLFIRLSKPLLRIELEETLCWALDWANSEVVAIGCTNGSIAVFNVSQALKSPGEIVLPTHYFSVHQSAIRALAWIRVPGVSADVKPAATDPTVVASGGYDGVECLTDIRDLAGNIMNRTRDVINSLCYSPYCGGPITIDHENIVKTYSISPSMLGRGRTLLEPDGPSWSLGASDYHPQLAVGVTDGSCLTTNTLRSTRRGGMVPFLVHKIYQLDYSRNTGEYRMLERFLPTEMQDRPTATRLNKVVPVGTGAWPPEVGIHRVAWNSGNGLGRAPLLASATGSGLCRVDWLLGRWIKNRIPYYGIQGIRQETDIADEDEESN